jgi:hypothetical protein
VTAKLLLTLVSTVILGSEFHGIRDHVLLYDGSRSLPHLALRLTGLTAEVKVKVMLRPTVSRPSSLGVSCGFVDVGESSLATGRVSHLQLLLAPPAQSVLCWSPTGLMTIFCRLRFEISPTRCWFSLYNLGADRIDNTASFIVDPQTHLPCRCLAVAASYFFDYSGFQPSYLEELRKITRTSVRIVGVPVEIQTGHLSSTVTANLLHFMSYFHVQFWFK